MQSGEGPEAEIHTAICADENQNGTHVPVTQRAETIAEDLEEQRLRNRQCWKNDVDAGMPPTD